MSGGKENEQEEIEKPTPFQLRSVSFHPQGLGRTQPRDQSDSRQAQQETEAQRKV